MNLAIDSLRESECVHLLCQEHLAYGGTRDVYISDLLPGMVVKVEEADRTFHNIWEWQLWQEVKDTAAAKWFAPCRFISPAGTILIQERTWPCFPKEYPKRLPAFFVDTKHGNFGRLPNKRVVCHDYADVKYLHRSELTSVTWLTEGETVK